ncbi:lytic transglycosylase domain-containing protein [Salinactinospora qingdaonensis]
MATMTVAGSILTAVAGVAGSAAPEMMPPGPNAKGGLVDTLGAATLSASTASAADQHLSPDDGEVVPDISPAWLDRVSERTGIPRRALQGYAMAQLYLVAEQPDCRISWPTLAGIGAVESVHGTYAGGEIGPDGRTTVDIIGIALNGENGTAAITDTDGGALDDDTTWDRAVGPMQFIPTTWERWGADAGDDGTADPHDIDDASLAAARYLCADGRDLTTREGWWDAILSYNQSEEYGEDVLETAKGYANAASQP